MSLQLGLPAIYLEPRSVPEVTDYSSGDDFFLGTKAEVDIYKAIHSQMQLLLEGTPDRKALLASLAVRIFRLSSDLTESQELNIRLQG